MTVKKLPSSTMQIPTYVLLCPARAFSAEGKQLYLSKARGTFARF
jgi:hypothetical protein